MQNKKKTVAKKMKPKFDLVASIIAHEAGELDEAGTRELFNHLNKKGLTNKLQGHYGRTNEAIKKGRYF